MSRHWQTAAEIRRALPQDRRQHHHQHPTRFEVRKRPLALLRGTNMPTNRPAAGAPYLGRITRGDLASAASDASVGTSAAAGQNPRPLDEPAECIAARAASGQADIPARTRQITSANFAAAARYRNALQHILASNTILCVPGATADIAARCD